MEHVRAFFQVVSLWCILGLTALLPFFLVPVSIISVPQSKLFLASVLLCIAVLAWFLSILFGRETKIPLHAMLFTVLLLPLAYIVSAVIVGWPSSAIVSGLGIEDTVVSIVLLTSLCVIVALSKVSITTFVRALVIGGFVLVVFQIARLLFPGSTSLGGVLVNSTASLAGTWHDLGIILALVALVCASFFSTRAANTVLWKTLFTGTGVLSFLFLFVVSMQDIWFVFAGTMGLFGVYGWFAGSRESEEGYIRIVRPALWLLIGALAFLAGWFNVAIHDRLPEALQIVSVEVRPSWEGTLSIGQSSLSDRRTLIFGTGPNTFARNWVRYKPAGVNETLFWNLDFNNGVGIVPTSLVTIGALGIGAWILIVLAFLWEIGNTLRREKLFEDTQTITFALFCSAILLFAFHVMYAPGIVVSALLFLVLGACIAHTAHKRFHVSFSFNSVGQFAGTIFVAIFVVGTVCAASVSALALTSDVYVNRSVALYNAEGSVSGASSLIQKALTVWPSNDRAHRAAVELGILELAQLGQRAGTDEAAKAQLETTLSQTIEHGLQAVSIDRADYQNWLILAQLYQELAGAGIEGAYEQAQQAYTTAREENPTSPVPVFRLAQLEVFKGNTSTAIELFSEAIRLKQDFAPAYFLRSQLLARQNRLDEAVASGAAAVQLVPEDPLGWYNLGIILYLKGSYNEAGAAFTQAVTLRNDYSNAIFMLGLTYQKVGGTEQAIAALTRVQELNPGQTVLAQMIANVRAGKDAFESTPEGTTLPQ